MAERADGVLDAGRAAAGLAGRVQEAVLALMRAARSGRLHQRPNCPALLGVDAAALCVEGQLPGARPLPRGTVARLLDGRAVVFRDAPADALLLHAEAARLALHDALVRVPGRGAADAAGAGRPRSRARWTPRRAPARWASSGAPWRSRWAAERDRGGGAAGLPRLAGA